jgi:hypothetical protein
MLADEKKGGQLDWESEITRNGRMAAVFFSFPGSGGAAASPKHKVTQGTLARQLTMEYLT